jgi:argininosuccinate lyase
MAEAADAPTSAATDLAEHLVAEGMPFREAHAVVGALVRRSLDEGIALRELVAAAPELGPDATFLLDRGTAVRRRTTPGGAGPEPVAAQLSAFAERLSVDRARWLG